MTFNVDKDTRKLVDATQDYDIDFHDDKYNWLTARQYEDSMRQVEVHVIQGDGSPFDLTGVNPVFEGWLPDSLHRVYDSKHSVVLDPKGGVFRFDFPARAFSVSGSYKQAFFRLMKDSDSIATLEFSLDILADKVISGIVPSDYVSPFEDLYGQLQDIINGADGKFDSQIADWSKQVNATITNLNADYSEIQTTYNAAKATLDSLSVQINNKGLMTKGDLDDAIKSKNLITQDNLNDQIKSVKSDVDNAMDHLTNVEQVFTLWFGMTATPGVALQLADDSSKFRKFKITIDDQNGSIETHEMMNFGTIAVESHNAYNTEPGLGIYEIVLSFVGNQATIKSNNSYVLSNGNMIPSPEKATIMRIEGVL